MFLKMKWTCIDNNTYIKLMSLTCTSKILLNRKDIPFKKSKPRPIIINGIYFGGFGWFTFQPCQLCTIVNVMWQSTDMSGSPFHFSLCPAPLLSLLSLFFIYFLFLLSLWLSLRIIFLVFCAGRGQLQHLPCSPWLESQEIEREIQLTICFCQYREWDEDAVIAFCVLRRFSQYRSSRGALQQGRTDTAMYL